MRNINAREIKIWYWVVRRLPKTLVYFCFMHVMSHSTTGKYGNTEVPALTGMDAISRYSDDNNV